MALITAGVPETALSSNASPLIVSVTLFDPRSIAIPLTVNLALAAAVICVKASSGAASGGVPLPVKVAVASNAFAAPDAPCITILSGFGVFPVLSKETVSPESGALVVTQALTALTMSAGVLSAAMSIVVTAPASAPGTFIVKVIGAEVL